MFTSLKLRDGRIARQYSLPHSWGKHNHSTNQPINTHRVHLHYRLFLSWHYIEEFIGPHFWSLPWTFLYLLRSFLLTIIVEKSKMCLDFSVTYFLIHLVISSFYYRVPATADWWIVHIAATIVMILVGEYLCSLRELSDIPLLRI